MKNKIYGTLFVLAALVITLMYFHIIRDWSDIRFQSSLQEKLLATGRVKALDIMMPVEKVCILQPYNRSIDDPDFQLNMPALSRHINWINSDDSVWWIIELGRPDIVKAHRVNGKLRYYGKSECFATVGSAFVLNEVNHYGIIYFHITTGE